MRREHGNSAARYRALAGSSEISYNDGGYIYLEVATYLRAAPAKVCYRARQVPRFAEGFATEQTQPIATSTRAG